MPQPKSTGDARRREQLAKLLDPLGLVLLTRERVQEALDDAVRRGRMTRDDAQELATALISRGRSSTEELLADLDQLLARSTRRSGGGARGSESGTSRRRGGLPIDDYDELTAAQITAQLKDLTPAQLRRVRDHERANANRKSVLQAVERKLD